jgi:hypothetical protein
VTGALTTHAVDERGSFAWVADPHEWMQRASLALALDDGGCALIDAVDHPGLDVALEPLGQVHAVVNLLDRHGRDCDALAARHGAPRLGPVEVCWPRALGPGVEGRVVVDSKRWSEACLWIGERGLLVCAEALGSAPYYRAGDERLGVHPLLRLRPPRRVFGDLAPRAIAVGHGPPLVDGASHALAEALATARRRLPRTWAGVLVRGVRRVVG